MASFEKSIKLGTHAARRRTKKTIRSDRTHDTDVTEGGYFARACSRSIFRSQVPNLRNENRVTVPHLPPITHVLERTPVHQSSIVLPRRTTSLARPGRKVQLPARSECRSDQTNVAAAEKCMSRTRRRLSYDRVRIPTTLHHVVTCGNRGTREHLPISRFFEHSSILDFLRQRSRI